MDGGSETLGIRLTHSAGVAERLMDRIATHPLVDRVLHPSRPGCRGHEFWQRDAIGSSGVFSVLFKPEAVAHVAAGLDKLRVFAIGASWGGTRSLAAPMPVRRYRTATQWPLGDLVLRLSIGLEAEEDVTTDMKRFFAELSQRTFPTSPAPKRAQATASVRRRSPSEAELLSAG